MFHVKAFLVTFANYVTTLFNLLPGLLSFLNQDKYSWHSLFIMYACMKSVKCAEMPLLPK